MTARVANPELRRSSPAAFFFFSGLGLGPTAVPARPMLAWPIDGRLLGRVCSLASDTGGQGSPMSARRRGAPALSRSSPAFRTSAALQSSD